METHLCFASLTPSQRLWSCQALPALEHNPHLLWGVLPALDGALLLLESSPGFHSMCAQETVMLMKIPGSHLQGSSSRCLSGA